MVAPRLFQPIALGVGLLVPVAAAAESPADRTGTGGGPRSTITAPNTTSTGVTKPPGGEEGPETPRDRRELERVKREDERIDNSVCDGCR